MNSSLGRDEGGGLERLCKRAPRESSKASRIHMGPGGPGIERAEAYFQGRAFHPHRHDTYAIGTTLAGVQSFRYRGEQRHCMPGQCYVLYPDELHDGGAGTDEGFGYRTLYIDPHLIQEALDGKPLPFVRTPVMAPSLFPEGLLSQIFDFDTEIDDLARVEIALATANWLLAAAAKPTKPSTLSVGPISRVRECIAASPAERHAMADLEHLSGLDRWTIARQFRALYGTSPSRFRTLRQLDHVRRLLRSGTSLAAASIEAGFADQSHMSRRFKSAYGLTPATWVSALA